MKGCGELLAALRLRYAPPEYALFTELRNGTGGHFTRTADALAMSVWPSRGLELIGFELKVSRADWQRELKNPKKAEAFCRYCDRWYLVAGEESIVLPGELPPTWGLLLPRGSKLAVKTEAPKLEARPVDRSFLAALLRQAHDASAGEQALVKAERSGYTRGHTDGKRAGTAAAESDSRMLQYEADRMKEQIAAFEAASGVSIVRYPGGHKIGEAVAVVLGGRMETYRQELEQLRQTARRIAEALETVTLPEDAR